MKPSSASIRRLRESLPAPVRDHLEHATGKIVAAKERGGRVVVVTGSGPNIHEGVTTQVAELIHKGLVDGVITSSAVIAHEMAGTLDRVKRVPIEAGDDPGFHGSLLPRGRIFEITLLSAAERVEMETGAPDGWDFIRPDVFAARQSCH